MLPVSVLPDYHGFSIPLLATSKLGESIPKKMNGKLEDRPYYGIFTASKHDFLPTNDLLENPSALPVWPLEEFNDCSQAGWVRLDFFSQTIAKALYLNRRLLVITIRPSDEFLDGYTHLK